MNKNHQREKRILALDPANRGIGFAVLEGPDRLIDWGVKEARDNRNDRALSKVEDLIEQYKPDVIVVEDLNSNCFRHGQRIQKLIKAIINLASKEKIKVRYFPRQEVREVFSQHNAYTYTKHQIATAIAERFPELSLRLPPFRKPWMSEDYRMAIFDAISFALTYFYFEDNKKGL